MKLNQVSQSINGTYSSNANASNDILSSGADYQTIKAFLDLIHGENAEICWQIFDDRKEVTKAKKHKAEEFHAVFSRSTYARLQGLNKVNCGIFHTVNITDGKGRTKANMVGINAYFADYDNVEPSNLDQLPTPTAMVQSKKGKHLYWKLEPGSDLGTFSAYQKSIALLTGGDKSINDTSRVLRCPGFYHMKDPATPYLVPVICLKPLNVYQTANFPKPPTTVIRAARLESTTTLDNEGNLEDLKTLVTQFRQLLPLSPLGNRQQGAKFRLLSEKLQESSRTDGTATDTMFMLGFPLSDLLTTETLGAEELVTKVYEACKARYGAEAKPDGTAWDENAAKFQITRGLCYGVKSNFDALKSGKKSAELQGAIEASVRYVSGMNIDYDAAKLTVIKSAIGTGKTTEMLRYIKELLAKDPDTRVTIVCHRTQLISQWKEALRELPFITYDDQEQVQKLPHVSHAQLYITTYDSLVKYNWGQWNLKRPGLGVVILDEVDQALEYIHTGASHFFAKRGKISQNK